MHENNFTEQGTPIVKAVDAGRDCMTHALQRNPAKTVKVHKFLIPNMGFRENLAFNFYATKEAIARFRGTAIADSAIEVAESALDENGVYDPPRYAPQDNRFDA